jgi:hypothetical protein
MFKVGQPGLLSTKPYALLYRRSRWRIVQFCFSLSSEGVYFQECIKPRRHIWATSSYSTHGRSTAPYLEHVKLKICSIQGTNNVPWLEKIKLKTLNPLYLWWNQKTCYDFSQVSSQTQQRVHHQVSEWKHSPQKTQERKKASWPALTQNWKRRITNNRWMSYIFLLNAFYLFPYYSLQSRLRI